MPPTAHSHHLASRQEIHNRMQGYWEHTEDGDIAAYYNYSASGERNFKLTSPRLHMSQNAYNTQVSPLVDPTLYASPLLTLSKHGYTKHYFEEGRRICSKIGGGFDAGLGQDIERPVGVISGSLYILHEQQRMSVQKTFTHDMNMEAGMEGVHDLSKVVMNHELGRDDPEPAFFYHSDHLGSAAYITDEYGQWTQMLNYLPYGEDWVERNRFNPADTTRLGIYRFNGKEKDHESGFHYYGARYYWSELLTGWLSVDPLMDKYPSTSPYTYCVWNPIKLVDPDGRDTLVFNKYGNYSHKIHADGEHVGRYDQPSGSPYVFRFADPENDPISIEKGEITKLQVVKEDDIRTMLFNAGVFRDENRDNKFGYAKKEGLGLGKLDFSHKAVGGMTSMYGDDTYRSMYLVDGVAHNPSNFGNFLFGAAGNALGIPLGILKLGAHFNSWAHPRENGYSPQPDSQDDQFSIRCGFLHAKQNRYNSIKDERANR